MSLNEPISAEMFGQNAFILLNQLETDSFGCDQRVSSQKQLATDGQMKQQPEISNWPLEAKQWAGLMIPEIHRTSIFLHGSTSNKNLSCNSTAK